MEPNSNGYNDCFWQKLLDYSRHLGITHTGKQSNSCKCDSMLQAYFRKIKHLGNRCFIKSALFEKKIFPQVEWNVSKTTSDSGDSTSISHSWLSKCPFVKQSCPFIEENSQFQIIIWLNSLRYINKVLLKRRNNLIFVTYFPYWYLMGFIYLSDSSSCKTRTCIMKYLTSTFSLIFLPKILIRTGGKLAKKLSPKIFTNIHLSVLIAVTYPTGFWYPCTGMSAQTLAPKK